MLNCLIMPVRTIPFVNGEFYHVYNRGLEKRPIFSNERDYIRFIETLFYYQLQNPKPKFSTHKLFKNTKINTNNKIVSIVAYCLMPNHFHLLIKQLHDGGISEFMRRFIHSYNKYRNIKYNRQGPVFQGMFKAVRVKSEEQLIHLSRYIHLNPLVSNLVQNLESYQWSSYHDYLGKGDTHVVAKEEVINFFKSNKAYQRFVLDQAEYGESLERIKHTLIDEH